MRARRREINIFNMSLLDILCGALGAFCFMMLVALPYYKPPGSAPELKQAQEKTERLLHDLDEMKARMRDATSAEDLSALVEQLKSQVRALLGQVNILTAEKEELGRQAQALGAQNDQLARDRQALQAQIAQLTETNRNLQTRLDAKKPFTVVVRGAELDQGLDVMLFRPSALEKSPNPLFQSWVDGQHDKLHAVRGALLGGRGVGVSINEDAPASSEGKLFVRLTNAPSERKPAAIEGAIFGEDEDLAPTARLPAATLTRERPWILLGTVKIDAGHIPRFAPATDAERDAAWESLIGSAPPPNAAPGPTPAGAERAAAQASRDRAQASYKKFTDLMSIPLDASGKNDVEILRLTGELLKELPPNSGPYKEASLRRQRVLDLKAKREGAAPPMS